MKHEIITDVKVLHNAPTSDNANAWSCENPEVKNIIRKWYTQLHFSQEYNAAFENALTSIPISDAIQIDSYDLAEPDGKRNLLSVLFMCEALSQQYAEKGIEEQILLDTLSDIGIWLNVWSDLKGEMHLGELSWLRRHLQMRIFRLGRLQFAFETSRCDCPQYGLKKGDPVIGVHIPADGPLTPEDCDASFEQAREFFAKYFPEYKYEYFTCHSWILDPVLQDILDKKSNIVQFQKRFCNVTNDPSDAILRYVFKWNTTASNLKFAQVLSTFAKTVKQKYLQGTQFHETYGIMVK